jgi:hypothetical protein
MRRISNPQIGRLVQRPLYSPVAMTDAWSLPDPPAMRLN